MFEVGGTYKTQNGEDVKITEESHVDAPDYWCVKGDDNKWRYARYSDCGRCTATDFNMSNPSNLVLPMRKDEWWVKANKENQKLQAENKKLLQFRQNISDISGIGETIELNSEKYLKQQYIEAALFLLRKELDSKESGE